MPKSLAIFIWTPSNWRLQQVDFSTDLSAILVVISLVFCNFKSHDLITSSIAVIAILRRGHLTSELGREKIHKDKVPGQDIFLAVPNVPDIVFVHQALVS